MGSSTLTRQVLEIYSFLSPSKLIESIASFSVRRVACLHETNRNIKTATLKDLDSRGIDDEKMLLVEAFLDRVKGHIQRTNSDFEPFLKVGLPPLG